MQGHFPLCWGTKTILTIPASTANDLLIQFWKVRLSDHISTYYKQMISLKILIPSLSSMTDSALHYRDLCLHLSFSLCPSKPPNIRTHC